MSGFSRYLTDCIACGSSTSKKYAREHEGQCKACVTGTPGGFPCPDCEEGRISAYQKAHGYHCNACTRQADPVGYTNEVMGYSE
jgi:hypothetical protein